MTHLIVEPDHEAASVPAPHVVDPGPVPSLGPSAPVPLPVIHRLMDEEQMSATYLCKSPLVVGSNALNTLFETSEVSVKALLDATVVTANKVQRAGAVKDLANFLIAGGEGQVAQRWAALGEINAKLNRTYLQVTKTGGYATTAELQRWATQIDLHIADAGHWGDLTKGRTIKWEPILLKIDPTASIPAPVLSAIQTHGKPGNPDLGQVATRLQAVFDTYPPNTPLVRATLDWGSVPQKSASENKASHVRKHFINDGTTNLTPDPDEHYEWMTRTGVKISRADVEGILKAPVTEPGLFESGTDLVETKPQAQKFFREFVRSNKVLADELLARYQDRYLDAVTAAAATMTGITVTVIGNSILLVGQSGDIFIAGRWQPTTQTFTISSGYINPVNKWNENQAFKIWSLQDG